MDDETLDAIYKIGESLDLRINDTMKDTLEQYAPEVVINVLINVATSMLAKALIMCEPQQRAYLAHIAEKFTEMKMKEGHAAVESLMAISKAMTAQGRAYTCQQQIPKKY